MEVGYGAKNMEAPYANRTRPYTYLQLLADLVSFELVHALQAD